jgi:transcription elongation factor GreA
MDKIYMSKEKLKELERELEELRTVKRKEIAEDLKYAKSLGDLSENAEYHEARNSQAIMESRIIELENMIKNAEIVVPHHSEAVEIGSVVTVLKENNQKSKNTYEIVGSGEADTAAGKISNESPLGQAMMGRKKGEEFEFETPGGKVSYTVLDVE